MMYNLEECALRTSGSQKNLDRLNPVLRNFIRPHWENGPWVAGGSIRRLLLGDDPLAADVDVFFANEAQKEQFLLTMETSGATVKKITRTNTTLEIMVPVLKYVDDLGEAVYENVKVTLQAIHFAYYESPEAVIDSFDFTICQFITDGEKLAIGKYSLWDLCRKRLAINKVSLAVSTVHRLVKYSKQGFYACPGTIGDILHAVANDSSLIRLDTPSPD